MPSSTVVPKWLPVNGYQLDWGSHKCLLLDKGAFVPLPLVKPCKETLVGLPDLGGGISSGKGTECYIKIALDSILSLRQIMFGGSWPLQDSENLRGVTLDAGVKMRRGWKTKREGDGRE